jgi:hypothetical protein
MALSIKAKRHIELAMVSKEIGDEISAAIDSGSNPQAADVDAIGTTDDLVLDAPVAVDLNSTFSDAEVEAALDDKADQAAVSSLMGDVEARMDVIEAKIDEVIAALKSAGLMAS